MNPLASPAAKAGCAGAAPIRRARRLKAPRVFRVDAALAQLVMTHSLRREREREPTTNLREACAGGLSRDELGFLPDCSRHGPSIERRRASETTQSASGGDCRRRWSPCP